MTAPLQDAQRISEFWFGDGAEYGQPQTRWFAKDERFEEGIRADYLALYEQALRGERAAWLKNPRTCLALIILLDQFPRNMFRNRPEAFGSDALALEAARHAVHFGFDLHMLPVERQFCYLPFEHSESLADQDEGARLMGQLRDFPATANAWVWAEKHRDVIARFGRFPHRNAVLARPSTSEEAAFLQQPGSSF